MYAIVDIAGQQFRVEKGQKIYVHRLDEEEGKNLNFDKVLLIDNEGKILIGEPVIEGAFIEGKVLTHLKGDKVIVFKKKRRKGYKVKKGHRQFMSYIEIVTINEKGAPKKSTVKPAEKPESEKSKADDPAKKPAPVAEAKETVRTAAKTETKAPASKKPVAKATAAMEPAAKKPAAKTTAAREATATKPATKKPAAKKPAAKIAASKKPMAAKPAAKSTTAAKPAKASAAAKSTTGGTAAKTTKTAARPKAKPKPGDTGKKAR